MTTIQQKIIDVETEMGRTQKNKATSYHLGTLKAKLAKFKRELVEGAKSKAGPVGEGFDVSKSGDARIGMVGFPSVGKSTLLTKLTGQFSKAANYEFTTLTCIPGVIKYQGAKLQLLDLPGIIEGAKDGKGRGKQVISVAKTCSLILIILDATKPMTHKKIIEKELEGFGIRLNRQTPKIEFKKKLKGGISVNKLFDSELDEDMVKTICNEYRITNCDITIRSECTEDDLIDVIEGDRKYIPCLYAMNKIDEISMEELEIISQIPHYIPICAFKEWNLDELIEKCWEYLDLIRIYTKPKGAKPDYDMPVVLPRKKSSVSEFCQRIHRTMLKQFRHAHVWGTSVKHNPQIVGKDHWLLDEDVVQIVKRV